MDRYVFRHSEAEIHSILCNISYICNISIYDNYGIPVDLNYNGIMKFEASKVEENSKETKFESEYVKMYGETEESAEMFELGEGIQDKEE